MNIYKIEDFEKPWFIGNFTPSVYRTKDFEFGFRNHIKGEYWDSHIHYKTIEINFLIKGLMTINNIILTAGTIFVIEKGEEAKPEFLEDCFVITVKVPSIPSDKFIVKK